MVLRLKETKMANEQPLKKKLRRTDETGSPDEPDFIQIAENGVHTLHLSLPPNVNEDDLTLNSVNSQLSGEKTVFRTSEHSDDISEVERSKKEEHYSDNEMIDHELPTTSNNSVFPMTYITNTDNISIKPAPDIITNSYSQQFVSSYSHGNYSVNMTPELGNNVISSQNSRATNHDRYVPVQIIACQEAEVESYDLESEGDDLQSHIIKQCLCGVSEAALRKPFEGETGTSLTGSTMLSEWPTVKILQFLSNLQLLFDVYLKQNNKGFICSSIVTVCENIANNEYNLIEQIISLCEVRDKYINYLTPRVLSSFLIISKTNVNNEWLEAIFSFLTTENIDYVKMNFALEVVKRVVEWKDVEIHVLEESQSPDVAGSSSQDVMVNINCVTVPFSDAESYDTSSIKGLVIRSLELRWPELINKIHYLILNNNNTQMQTCILTFLALWESTISVKANLSVIDTKPFYAHLEKFVIMLNNNLSSIIWKQLLSLFNEVLCYGSTLALQDILPNDTCQLAHLIVRYVKDFRLLDSLPYRRSEGLTVNSFVGTIPSTCPSQSNIDKTLLQKMVLLVLKSVAITIKETRSDSSDSSVGSDDFDYYQDMQLIERSIRDVLKKVDSFIKSSLDFHPETPFSKLLIHLFNDQDDYMIEAMVCTLDTTVGISYRNSVYPDLLTMLNPTYSFVELLKIVSHDSGVLLDFLVSNETCFLLYLLRFLKYTKKNWGRFVSSCSEGGTRTNDLDSTMTVLNNLKDQILSLVKRELFPYNIKPILRLLEICDEMYKGNESS